jgi:site-specific DNA-methyltransferase (adenine-specific)
MPPEVADFIYVDGPYYTQKDWGDFADIFESLEDYLGFMEIRLEFCKRVLKKTGTICVQADYRAVHYLKVMLDKIYGYRNLINELIWDRNNKGGYRSKIRFNRTHETILVYSKGKAYTFNMQYEPLTAKRKSEFRCDDNDGMGPYKWQYATHYKNLRDLEEGLRSGKYKWPADKKCPYYKLFLNTHKGIPPGTVIKGISSCRNSKRKKYATSKPEKLLTLLIKSLTNRGDIVLEPFCGSAPACIVAKRLGRNFFGCDINPAAVKEAKKWLKAEAWPQ